MTLCGCGGEIVTLNHGDTYMGKVKDEVCNNCGKCKRTIEPPISLNYITVSINLNDIEEDK